MRAILVVLAVLAGSAPTISHAQAPQSDAYRCAHGDPQSDITIQACDRKDVAASRGAIQPSPRPIISPAPIEEPAAVETSSTSPAPSASPAPPEAVPDVVDIDKQYPPERRSNPLMTVFWVLVGLYFVPSLIAVLRGKRNAVPIVALNVFLGWTFVGWVVTFVWSLMSE